MIAKLRPFPRSGRVYQQGLCSISTRYQLDTLVAVKTCVGIVVANVLIVDTRTELAGVMVSLLAVMGHKARLLDQVGDVSSIVESFRPDMAFLDLELPSSKSIFELAQQLRQHSATLRLFGMSALPESTWPENDVEVFERYLLKPISSRTLRDLLGEQAGV